jgi:glycosyltransferase involved in cell wall biosynthesis
MPVKLLYLANNRIPSEKANSLQIMQMCDAFQSEGVDVRLVVPWRLQPRAMRSVQDPFTYYGLRNRFPIVYLPCADALEVAPRALERAAFAVQSSTFALSVAAYLATARADVYYSRDPLSTLLVAAAPVRVRRRAIYEAHSFPSSSGSRRLHLWAARRIGRIVCITQGLAEEYLSRGIPESRVLVAPDAVDLERFGSMPSREEARRQLGVPEGTVMACYTGHLYRWKGAHALAEASELLPPGYLVYLVGGTEEDLAAFRRYLAERGLARVKLAGWVPPDQVIPYLAAADVLVLPNSAADAISSRYTSPMKLFEYMAARRPIVASRLPSLQEILRHGENAILVTPDDPKALAAGIQQAASESRLAEQMVQQAWRDVEDHSWGLRSRRILDAIGGDGR